MSDPGALDELAAALPGRVSTSPADLTDYSRDQGPVVQAVLPSAVIRAQSVEDVQALLRWATRHGVPVVSRGAGSGLSGGAHATRGSVILSLELMNRIVEVNPDDETAVVEPGVINADLNAAVAEYGLMYAPDPASYRWSTIGGNVATNAGGLRCAKYGVTRDSVLALDVVLADGTLVSTGHRTFKGVAGYDLTALMTGSEGTLGVIVGITVRLRYLPRAVHTLAAFVDDFPQAAAGVLAIGRARVQPAILELLDGRTLEALDGAHGSDLRRRGGSLLLVRTDGFGAAAEAEAIRAALAGLGASVSDEGSEEADRLVDLRRHSRGDEVDDLYRVGEDVAVPKSQLVRYVAALEAMAVRHDVRLKVVAHAGTATSTPRSGSTAVKASGHRVGWRKRWTSRSGVRSTSAGRSRGSMAWVSTSAGGSHGSSRLTSWSCRRASSRSSIPSASSIPERRLSPDCCPSAPDGRVSPVIMFRKSPEIPSLLHLFPWGHHV